MSAGTFGKPIYPGPKSSPTHCPRCGAIYDRNSQAQHCPHTVFPYLANTKAVPRG